MSAEFGLWLGLRDNGQRTVESLAGTFERTPDIKGQAHLKAIGGALGGTQSSQDFSKAKRDKRGWGQVGGRLGILAGCHGVLPSGGARVASPCGRWSLRWPTLTTPF
jgi:hypothetical protein